MESLITSKIEQSVLVGTRRDPRRASRRNAMPAAGRAASRARVRAGAFQAAQAAAFLQNKTANFLSAVSMYGFALVCPLMLAYLCFVVYAHLGGTDVSLTAIATIVATQLFGWFLTYLLVQLSHAFNLPIADASSPGGFRPLK